MGGHIYSPDGELMFRTTQSLVEKKSLAIEPLPTTFGTKEGINKKEYAQYGIGQPILATPFYLFGKGLVKYLPDKTKSAFVLDTTQYHSMNKDDFVLRFAVSLFNQFITALTCVILFSFLYLITNDKKASVLVTIIYGLSTIAFVHSKPFFSEALTTLCVLLVFFFIRIAIRKKANLYLILAGIFCGYSIVTRLDSVVSLPAISLYFLLEIYNFYQYRWQIRQGLSPSNILRVYFNPAAILKYILFAIPVIIQLLIILYLNKIRYGSFISTGYEDQTEGIKFSNPLIIGLYGYLFSIGKGLFFFSPPLILYFASIRKFLKEHKSEAISTTLLIISYLVFYSMWQNWDGGWCWGPRHIFIIHIFLAIPIVSFLKGQLTRSKEVILGTLLVIGFAVQIYGASQNFIDFYVDYYRDHNIEIKRTKLYKEFEQYQLNYYDRAQEIPKYYSTYPFPAPLYHSIYIPYHTQWIGYLDMIRRGKNDFFLLHLTKKL